MAGPFTAATWTNIQHKPRLYLRRAGRWHEGRGWPHPADNLERGVTHRVEQRKEDEVNRARELFPMSVYMADMCERQE